MGARQPSFRPDHSPLLQEHSPTVRRARSLLSYAVHKSSKGGTISALINVSYNT